MELRSRRTLSCTRVMCLVPNRRVSKWWMLSGVLPKRSTLLLWQSLHRGSEPFKFGAGASEDPFEKLKGLIADLIKRP